MNTIYVKINDTQYPAQVNGRLKNTDWDDRDTKAITLEMAYTQALETFVEGLNWSIVIEREQPVPGEDGKPTGQVETVREEYDNSDYSMAGDITDHRDGTVTVVMGKPTELENVLALLLMEGVTGNV